MSEYILYGTTEENLEQILKSGFIKIGTTNNYDEVYHDIVSRNSVNQILTQLIYRNLPKENIEQPPNWYDCIIVLDKKILKDYPFYATKFENYCANFENAFSNKNILCKGKGNLKKNA
jgi:hypothetical protein